jgi:hypothetical protein
MASTERDVPVRFHVFGMERTYGVARVRERDPGERGARALKAAGICLGFAVLSVFIPIAHFVLVPSFLLAGVFFAFRRLRERASLVKLTGVCPRCREERTFEASGAFLPAMKTTCPVCSFSIDVDAGAGAGEGAGPDATRRAGAGGTGP